MTLLVEVSRVKVSWVHLSGLKLLPFRKSLVVLDKLCVEKFYY